MILIFNIIMDKSTYLIYELFPLSRFLVIFIIYKLSSNLIFSLVLFGIIQKLYYIIISKTFNLIPLSNTDKIFINNSKNQDYSGICFMRLDKDKHFEYLELYKQTILKKKPRSRSVLKFLNCEFWFEVIPFEEAIKKLKIRYIDNILINDEKDICIFAQKELQRHVDILNGEFPYEIIVFSNKESQSVIAFKFHHILSDGMGFITTFMSLTNNYSPSIFPYSVKKISFLKKIIFYIITILTIPINLFYIIKSVSEGNTGPSPFKFYNHNQLHFPTSLMNKKMSDMTYEEIITIKNEVSSTKCSFKTPLETTLFACSKLRKLESIKKITKHLKMSFNDLVTIILTSAIGKFFKVKGYLKDQVTIIIPINLRGIPENFRKSTLENNTTGFSFNLPLVKNSNWEDRTIKKKLGLLLKNHSSIIVISWLFNFLMFFFPDKLAKFVYHKTMLNSDLNFSNLGGPKEKVFYENKIGIINYYPYMTAGLQGCFITLNSYNGEFSMSCGVNEGINLNPWEVIEYIEEEFNLIEEKYN